MKTWEISSILQRGNPLDAAHYVSKLRDFGQKIEKLSGDFDIAKNYIPLFNVFFYKEIETFSYISFLSDHNVVWNLVEMLDFVRV